MTYADLFTGIGCMSLAASLNGCKIIFKSEIEAYPNSITGQYWPDVPNLGDIQTADFRGYAGMVDILAGGFPCQDISNSGKGAGIMGKKSRLWHQFYRCIKEILPRYVIIENSNQLPKKGLDWLLCDLARIGYDAEWCTIPAALLGANHVRPRTWILAYPNTFGRRGQLCMLVRILHEKRSREIQKELDSQGSHFLQFEKRYGQPPVFGKYDGISRKLHIPKRVQALGNALYWPIPYLIIKTIKEIESMDYTQYNEFQLLLTQNF